MLSMGVMAGFSITETLRAAPGLVRDMFQLYLLRNGYQKKTEDDY